MTDERFRDLRLYLESEIARVLAGDQAPQSFEWEAARKMVDAAIRGPWVPEPPSALWTLEKQAEIVTRLILVFR